MAEETPHLDPIQLYDKRKTKDIYKLKAYNKILEQIYQRVLTNSRLPNSPAYILYQTPMYVYGLPKLDMEDLIVYLVHQLRHAKYEVRYTYPSLLYVSWKHHEQQYIMNESPIMQTMLASFEKSEAEKEASRLLYSKKSQRKVRMQTPGEMQKRSVPVSAIQNVLHRGFPPNGQSQSERPVAAPPIASASEYVPPSSFLQNIMNPPSNPPKQMSSVDYLR
jgi:hypothetical protein